MILRGLARSLQDQNWTAIAIEFVLLVLGVFLGIQVANWNQANADRRVAGKYLADIAADVRSDLDELARTRESAHLRISASTYLLRAAGLPEEATQSELVQSDDGGVFSGFERIAIPDVAPPPASQRGRLWADATRIYMYDTNRSSYDALVSSGRIELIDDPRIARALREYYYLVNSLSTTQARTIAPLRQHILEAGIAHGHTPWGASDEAVLVGQLKGDPAFAATVSTSRQLTGVHLLLCAVLDKKGRDLLQLLEGKHSP